jgi:hypothetical protein
MSGLRFRTVLAPAIVAAMLLGPVARLGAQQVVRPAPSSDELAALQLALSQAAAADSAPDQSIDHINQRIERWSMVLLLASTGSPEAAAAQAGVAQARSDLQAARTAAFTSGAVDDATRGIFDAKLAAARDYLSVRDWALAEENLRYVLDRNPTYPPALSLAADLERRRGSRDSLVLLLAAALVLVTAAGVGILIVRLGFRHRDAAATAGPVPAGSPGVRLEVVEGVGRGKTVAIPADRPLFRIGASAEPRGADRNDLVISDRDAMVSRFHCHLVRGGADYYLVDASTNGTFLNGKRLNRGEHRRLESGDEIVLADASRFVFHRS